MAESPLVVLGRLLTGVFLMRGRLPHQVLGHLLVMGTNEVAIAGAAAVVAGTARQRNAAAQAAIRTAVPALAVRALMRQQELRLERREANVAKREREVKAAKATVSPTRLALLPAPAPARIRPKRAARRHKGSRRRSRP